MYVRTFVDRSTKRAGGNVHLSTETMYIDAVERGEKMGRTQAKPILDSFSVKKRDTI